MRADASWAFVVVYSALAGLVLAGVFVFRLAGPLMYDPAVVQGKTRTDTATPHNRINLYDGRRVRQTFRATAANMSHVGIGVAALPHSGEAAVLTVELHDDRGEVLWRGHALVERLRTDDVTLLPAPVRLSVGNRYVLELATSGVEAGSGLALYYESDTAGFAEGEVEVVDESGGEARQDGGQARAQRLPGNARFQIWRWPTKWVVWDTFWRSASGWLLSGYAVAVVLAWLLRARLAYWAGRWLKPLALLHPPVAWRELIFPAVLSAALAFSVTLPYYTGLDKITTAGDVQRALVYRAVARGALLNSGEVGLWNPYLCGGEPLLANMESAQWDPFFLLVLAFGENLGLRLSATATLAIGFLGAYMLARGAGLTRLAALLAGALFSFSGFQMLAFANGNFAWLPAGLIPWVVYFYLCSLARALRPALLAAVTLALIFYGGSLHMTLYAVMACGVLAVFLALRCRSWRPAAMLALICLLFLPLSALKLLPAAEAQAVSGEFERPPPFVQPWGWLGKMFWDRGQLEVPPWRFAETGEYYRWIEYGAYIGAVPAALVLAGAVASRGNALTGAITGAAVVLLLITFGEFPWTVLHRLPFLYGPLRNPQRARVILLLMLGVLAGWGLAAVQRVFGRLFGRVSRWGAAGIAALVLWDLATFHGGMYPRLFSLDRPSLPQAESFVRLHESYTDEERGYYKVSYENYRAGFGVADMCMPYMMQRGAYARGVGGSNPAAPYRGEAFLTEEGEISGVSIGHNTVRVAFAAERDSWLVVSQNFFPGWRTEPPREVRNWQGLAAARVTPQDREVLFRYRPLSYVVGRWITGVAAVLVLIMVLRGRSRRTVGR